MNVLIFGGTGFVGRNLIGELLKNGYQVYVVTRNPQKTASSFENKVKVIEWDNVSPLSSIYELQQTDVVINLAGESIGNRRWINSVKDEILASRIRTTRAIVTAINNGTIQPKVLINASAVGYYGPREDDELTESDEVGQDFLAQVCRDWEKEAYKVLGEVLNRPSWLPVPEILLKIVLGQMAEMLIHGQRVIPKKILSANFEYRFSKLRAALEDALENQRGV